MPKRAKRSSSTRIAALLFVTVLMTLVVIALGSSVRSDYAEALIPDRTFIGAGLGSKPSSSTPGDGKVVARQATVRQGISGTISGGEPDNQAQTSIAPPVSADASTRTLTKTVLSDEGKLYVVTAIFGEDAEIPYDARLEVEERSLTDDGKAILRQGLGLTEDEASVSEAVLDIRLVSGGVYVEPKARIDVEVASTVIQPADSYAVTAMRIDGTETVAVPMENLTGVDADGQVIEEPGYSRLKLSVGKMGEFALSTVLEKKYVWSMENETVTIWGPRSVSVELGETVLDEGYAEGLTMLRRIRAKVDPSAPWASNLWASAERDEGASQGLGGVRCHAMSGDELGAEVFGPSGSAAPVALPAGVEYAFLWDDGYRTSTAEVGAVSLTGLMPLGVEVWADDATSLYADANAVVGVSDDDSFGYRTVTAFDARYIVQGDAWSPDAGHAVTATVAVVGATAQTDLQAWHASKDGQFVRVPGVRVVDGKVTFAMDDDGVYILVEGVSYERELAATDGATYRVTVNYNRAAGLPDGVQLTVSEVARGTASYFDHTTQSMRELGVKSRDVTYAKECERRKLLALLRFALYRRNPCD